MQTIPILATPAAALPVHAPVGTNAVPFEPHCLMTWAEQVAGMDDQSDFASRHRRVRRKTPLSQSELQSVVDYDPDTGVFTWRPGVGKNRPLGGVCGSLDSKGYVEMTVLTFRSRAHRFAWLYVHGEWPELPIDHFNGDRTDNRITNLRAVSRTVNAFNRHAPSSSNTGLLGATRLPNGKFFAQIGHKYRNISLGCYDTAEQAHAIYMAEKARLCGPEYAAFEARVPA